MSEDVPEYGSAECSRLSRALTVEQAADLLNVRPKTVRALAAGGIIPAVKLGKFWRFDAGLLREWLHAKARANVREPQVPADLPPIAGARIRHGAGSLS